jgi:hypothetical protein
VPLLHATDAERCHEHMATTLTCLALLSPPHSTKNRLSAHVVIEASSCSLHHQLLDTPEAMAPSQQMYERRPACFSEAVSAPTKRKKCELDAHQDHGTSAGDSLIGTTARAAPVTSLTLFTARM